MRMHCSLKKILSSILLLLSFCWAIPVSAGVYSPAPYYANLLLNPNGDETDFSGWTLTSNGGDGWAVDRGIYPEDNAGHGFMTSYDWDVREQLVDLVTSGFSADYLDAQPTITVSEIFEKIFCPDRFFIDIELLDRDKRIISRWSSGELQHTNTDCDYSGYKQQVRTELTHYGAGVRYIRWRDGGKDSEWWQGHYGPKLQNAYLALAPANLLNNPGELSSWRVNSPQAFEVTGPPEARQFKTTYFWGQRQQIIDLLARGFTSNELDSGQLPIIAEGVYREVACPDKYYLTVDLLDASYRVLATESSGTRIHDGDCDWSYSLKGEKVNLRFVNYPTGVRHIRWEDGGKDSEYWAGRFGSILEAPYLGIDNYSPVSSGYGRLLQEDADWHGGDERMLEDYALNITEADSSSTFVTPAQERILSEVAYQPTDSQAAWSCDASCLMNKIRAGLDDPKYIDKLWSVDGNSDIRFFSSPQDGVSNLQQPGQDLLAAIQLLIYNGTKLIDITTLDDISSEWRLPICNALKMVEQRAASARTSPVVRIHLGFSDPWDGLKEEEWDPRLRSVLSDLTSCLKGNSGMKIYISGYRRGSLVQPNWNHAKIVAVDGKEAIVGGHNLWGVYLNQAPVFDTSIKVTGNSAMAAHRFVDEIWDEGLSTFPSTTHVLRWWGSLIEGSIIDFPLSGQVLINGVSSPGGPIQVLGVGQTSSDHASPLKRAVLNMVNAAGLSIYISQQELTHFLKDKWYYPLVHGATDVDEDLAVLLVQKALSGIPVEIVLSNTNAGYGTYANTDNKELLQLLWKAARQRGVVRDTAEIREKVCQHLKLGALRIDSYRDGFSDEVSFANHSKTILVDKKAFLVGSHNLYSQNPGQLNEYAFIVADPAKAEEFYNVYWKSVLKYSTRTFIQEDTCKDLLDKVRALPPGIQPPFGDCGGPTPCP